MQIWIEKIRKMFVRSDSNVSFTHMAGVHSKLCLFLALVQSGIISCLWLAAGSKFFGNVHDI